MQLVLHEVEMHPLTDAPLVNRCFDSLNELEQVLADQCLWLAQQEQIVRSATRFEWWPTVA